MLFNQSDMGRYIQSNDFKITGSLSKLQLVEVESSAHRLNKIRNIGKLTSIGKLIFHPELMPESMISIGQTGTSTLSVSLGTHPSSYPSSYKVNTFPYKRGLIWGY